MTGLAALALVVVAGSAATAATAATIVVTGPGDTPANDGVCTLREAILAANLNAPSGAASGECAAGAPAPAIDEIRFAIPGAGVRTIAPGSALPTLTGPTTIDGYTQPGAHPNTLAVGDDAVLLVELDGGTAGVGADGLTLAGGTTVRGLAINRFGGDGIVVSGVSGCTVAGNFVGLDPTGTLDRGNGGVGVRVAAGATGTLIGGTSPADRNVISGQDTYSAPLAVGVWLDDQETTGTVVIGNYIGTNAAGTVSIRNDYGVYVTCGPPTRIGGATPGERNVISGNWNTGVVINGGSDTTVSGNYIGVDSTGETPLGNGNQGLRIDNASHCRVGGATPADRNVISANHDVGVRIAWGYDTQVRGNYVGLSAGGTSAMVNESGGVAVFSGTANAILGNRIATVNGLAIELDVDGFHPQDGVTPNDPLDADTGPNQLQNFPDLAAAYSRAGAAEVRGTLSSTPSASFTVELFGSPACHPSGHGDARTVLGTVPVATDAAGNASFVAALPVGLPVGSVVSATATDAAGNTSELSACATVRAWRPLRRVLRMP